jgi:membrane protein implicated in regulation of membrane protease activity
MLSFVKGMLCMLTDDPLHIWYLIAAFFIFIESIAATVALLFVGLGALTTAITIHLNVISSDDYLLQSALALISSGGWALIMWKPIKNLKNANKNAYSNIVGDYATIVGGNLSGNNSGSVKWSGTIMNARIADPNSNQSIAEGSLVEIVKVEGNTLFIKKK